MRRDADHARIPVPPPFVFLAFAIAALVLNWGLPFSEPWLTTLRPAGGAAIVGGLLLGGSAVLTMRQAGTSPDPFEPTVALVTDGPYRITRNPIYLGFFLIYLGFTSVAGTLWGLLLSPLLLATVTVAIIRREEEYLAGRFADRYGAYKARVRKWL